MKPIRTEQQANALGGALADIGRKFQALILDSKTLADKCYPAPKRLWLPPPLVVPRIRKVFGYTLEDLSKLFYAYSVVLEEALIEWGEIVRAVKDRESPDIVRMKRLYPDFHWAPSPPPLERMLHWLYLTHCSFNSRVEAGRYELVLTIDNHKLGVRRSTLVSDRRIATHQFRMDKSFRGHLSSMPVSLNLGSPHLCATYDLLHSYLPHLGDEIDFVTSLASCSGRLSSSFTDYFYANLKHSGAIYDFSSKPENEIIGYRHKLTQKESDQMAESFYSKKSTMINELMDETIGSKGPSIASLVDIATAVKTQELLRMLS